MIDEKNEKRQYEACVGVYAFRLASPGAASALTRDDTVTSGTKDKEAGRDRMQCVAVIFAGPLKNYLFRRMIDACHAQHSNMKRRVYILCLCRYLLR